MSKSAPRLIDWLLAASFLSSLFAHAYLGSYSRYMGDDYTISNIVRTHGLLGSQFYWYDAWTGRFSFTFVASLLGLMGSATPRFIPALLLALWFVGTIWAISQIHFISGRISWAKAVLFAGFLIFATLETAPNVAQSLYWQTGALTYVAPLIPVSLYVGVVSRGVCDRHRHSSYKFNLAGAGILTFVAGGFSDAYVILQTCGLILFIVAVEIFAGVEFKYRIRALLIAGLIGSLIAFTIIALAPGNSIRQSYFPTQFVGWDILRLTLWYSFRFVAKVVLNHPIISLASLTLPLLIRVRDFSHNVESPWDRRLCIWLLLTTPVAVFLLIMCCAAASVYSISVMLPERAQILLSLVFICGALVWSRAAGELLMMICKVRQNTSLLATVALVLLTFSPIVSFFHTLGLRDEARNYAADWDRQDLELKTAKQSGVTDVAVRQIWDFQFRIGKGPSDLHLRTDPAFWINRGTATYYGLGTVRATDDVATSR